MSMLSAAEEVEALDDNGMVEDRRQPSSC